MVVIAEKNLSPVPERWSPERAQEIQKDSYLAPYTPVRNSVIARDIAGLVAIDRLSAQTLPTVVLSRVDGKEVVVQGREVIDALAAEEGPGWWLNVVRNYPLELSDFLGLANPKQTPQQLLSRAGITYYNYKPGAIRWYVRFRNHSVTGKYVKLPAPRADLMRDEVIRYGSDKIDHFIRNALLITEAYPLVAPAVVVGLFMEANEAADNTEVVDNFVSRLVYGGAVADDDPVKALSHTLMFLNGTGGASGEKWRDRQGRLFSWVWEDVMHGNSVVKGDKGREALGPITYNVDKARFTPVIHVDEAAVRALREVA